jgi:hypothetical protein
VWHLSLMTVREFDCDGATDIWFAEEDLAPSELVIKHNLSEARLRADALFLTVVVAVESPRSSL